MKTRRRGSGSPLTRYTPTKQAQFKVVVAISTVRPRAGPRGSHPVTPDDIPSGGAVPRVERAGRGLKTGTWRDVMLGPERGQAARRSVQGAGTDRGGDSPYRADPDVKSPMLRRSLAPARRLLVVMCVIASVLLAAWPAAAQAEREHFQVKLSPSYDEGDFGTSETTRTFFLPLMLRYLGEKFDVAATFFFIRLDSPGDVVIIDGVPTPSADVARDRRVESGFGDIVLKGRYFLIDDPGLPSPVPSIVPFLKLKIPTGSERKNLSTGKTDVGFGVEWDKTLGNWIMFGDLSYTIIGDPEGVEFRNRPAASIGASYRMSTLVAVSGLLDWRRAVVRGRDDALEVVGLVTFRITRTLALTPNALVGLTDGSPDWGIGIELSYRFGRW